MKSHFIIGLIIAGCLPFVSHAQATRTWVSGVGDDANPGSRTAPCKTFAGAISKTAPGGVIDVLDPGGFGAVTITKSITIVGDAAEGDILVSGTHALIINAAATDVVVLRNLTFEGLGAGLSGINIISAGEVHVENCRINAFSQNGINYVSSVTNGVLYVKDTTIHGCGGAGINVAPTASGSAILERVDITSCGSGIDASGNSVVGLSGSTVARNSTNGIIAYKPAKILSSRNNIITGNGSDGKASGVLQLK
jgi:hypothetical protein